MKRNEKGFTLIGVLVAAAITTLIVGGAAVGTVQIIQGVERSSDHTIAVRQAQSAGFWISNDAMMGRNINIGDNPGTGEVEFITVYWKDWSNGDIHEIRYIWLDSSGGLKKLNRNYLISDKDEVEIENKTTFVADKIYMANFSEQDGVWRLTVESRSGTRSETREYEISQRVEL